MPRPRHVTPTPAELEVLKLLWERGASTVREVMNDLNAIGPTRAYTSVMSLMNVMADKGLLERSPQGRAFVYRPTVAEDRTLAGMLGELLQKAFDGSANLLVSRLLEASSPTEAELAEIRKTLEKYRQDQKRGDA